MSKELTLSGRDMNPGDRLRISQDVGGFCSRAAFVTRVQRKRYRRGTARHSYAASLIPRYRWLFEQATG